MSADASGTYAPPDYEMNPEFEDLVRGAQLRNGMIVLVENMRENPEYLTGPHSHAYTTKRIRETSRWCTVTDLEIRPRHDAGDLVQFIGEYADGTKASRTYDESYCWYVKKESIPEATS